MSERDRFRSHQFVIADKPDVEWKSQWRIEFEDYLAAEAAKQVKKEK